MKPKRPASPKNCLFPRWLRKSKLPAVIMIAILTPMAAKGDLMVQVRQQGTGTQWLFMGDLNFPAAIMGVGGPFNGAGGSPGTFNIEYVPLFNYSSGVSFIGPMNNPITNMDIPTVPISPPPTGGSGFFFGVDGNTGSASFFYYSTSNFSGLVNINETLWIDVPIDKFNVGTINYGAVGGAPGDGISLKILQAIFNNNGDLTRSFMYSALPFNQAVGQIGSTLTNTSLRDVNHRQFRARQRVDRNRSVNPCGLDLFFGPDSCFSFNNEASKKYTRYQQFTGKHSINLSGGGSPNTGSTVATGAPVLNDEVPWISVEKPAGGKVLAPDVVAAGHKWEMYATADFGEQDLDPIVNQPGMESHLQTATVGFEYTHNDNWAFGLGWAHVWNDNTLGNNLGSADFEGDAVMGYATYFRNNRWADLLYSYGSYESDLRRNTGLGTVATASPDQTAHQLSLNIGHNYPAAETVVHGPTFGLDYSWGALDAYTETGAGAANTRFAEQEFDSLISRLGWQISWAEETNFGILTPQARIAWARENMGQNQTTSGVLINSPVAIGGTRNSFRPGDDWIEVGFGCALQIRDNVSLFADYTAQLARQDLDAHYGRLTAAVMW